MLDSNDPLVALADTINWEQFDDSFEKYYSDNGRPAKPIRLILLINLVNKYMKKVLGEGFTSHSFRQGLLTEMGSRSINPKIIQSFIGHADVKTTLRYIKPTANDVKMSLVR